MADVCLKKSEFEKYLNHYKMDLNHWRSDYNHN